MQICTRMRTAASIWQTATLCLQYVYHILPDGNSYAHAHINYEKGLFFWAFKCKWN